MELLWISYTMHDKILKKLIDIQHEQNVHILYAVESGSRAWGFASRDSDFDVRFIYVHSLDWYLSIEEKRAVIECPISDSLDISGWDLRKALQLFRKSNPPLLEWLRSPIVYMEPFGVAQRLRELMSTFFSPKQCMYHYLHMAKGNFREYLHSEKVRVKKYFYILRPVLACKWIEKYNTMPPTEFERLFTDQPLEDVLIAAVQDLLDRKKAGDELDKEPRIGVINEFLKREIEYYSLCVVNMESKKVDDALLDNLFRHTLKEINGEIFLTG